MTDTGRKNQDFKEKISTGEPMRLNKFLSDAGVCSRRQADRYVEQGRITIDGEPAQMGQKVLASQDIRVDGKRVTVSRKQIVLAVNKPKGIVCTTEKRERDNIVDFLKYPERVYPVGRLDKDSTGLLILTNDGDLINELTHPSVKVPKIYIVTVNSAVHRKDLEQMANGVEIEPNKMAYADIQVLEIDNKHTEMQVTLYQGMNRQIRKMFEYFGYEVKVLKRVQHATIRLDGLKRGDVKPLKPAQIKELKNFLNRISI